MRVSPRFADRHIAVRIESAEFLCVAVGPSNLSAVDSCCLPESEMNAEIVLRKIAATAADFGHLFLAARFDFDAGADGTSVTSRAFQPEADPMVRLAGVVPEEAGTAVEVDDENVEVAVIVEVRDGGAAGGFADQEIC